MAVPLPLGVADPGLRLREIAAETANRKARTRTSLGTLFGGRIARRLVLWAVLRQRVNVCSASIPGPQVPLYLAGAQVLEVFPILPLIANEPLGVGALSYAGRFTIGVVADRDACPRPRRLRGGPARGAAPPRRADPSHVDPSYWGDGDPCQCSGLSGAGQE
jgi:diacylglycerol O-acyltransferase